MVEARGRRWGGRQAGCATRRGYSGIGVEGASKSANIDALLRAGHAFGAAFCFTVGPGWDRRAARTVDTANTPLAWAAVALPGAGGPGAAARCSGSGRWKTPSFRHPLNAAYVLGRSGPDCPPPGPWAASVGSMGAAVPAVAATGHGAPRFRRIIPDRQPIGDDPDTDANKP
ncbi:hypothetical protein [Rhodopila sp.]|uniref:hypothetical protein n=1 Tax=Rhodopila sp. TaxID=2480087 RepID=UPI003D14E547